MAGTRATPNEISKLVEEFRTKYSNKEKSAEPNFASNEEGQETFAKADSTDTEDEPFIMIAKLLKHVTPKDAPFVVEVIVNGMATINAAKKVDEKEAVGAGAIKSSSTEEEMPLNQRLKVQEQAIQSSPRQQFSFPPERGGNMGPHAAGNHLPSASFQPNVPQAYAAGPRGGNMGTNAAGSRYPSTSFQPNVPQAYAARPRPSRSRRAPDHGFGMRNQILNPIPDPWDSY